ncbi:Uncharacterised protein [Chromobacterium violaceum]|uniref:Uncharacterized protein n=1 Tax=Chromobacterium violaceum TaxID=536 RepID=A0A447T9A4_CHRVL|nr:Uncharacterised protein [Chromobacterium violaceum]
MDKLSRRTLLKASLAAGAGLCVPNLMQTSRAEEALPAPEEIAKERAAKYVFNFGSVYATENYLTTPTSICRSSRSSRKAPITRCM